MFGRRKERYACKNHPDRPAFAVCHTCRNYFCKDDVQARQVSEQFTAYICKECGGRCDLVEDLHRRKKRVRILEEKVIGPDGGDVITRRGFFWTSPSPRPEAGRREKQSRKQEAEGSPRVKGFWRYVPGAFLYPLMGAGMPVMALFAGVIYALSDLLPAYHPFLTDMIRVGLFTYFLMYAYKVMDSSVRGIHRMPGFVGLRQWIEYASPVSEIVLTVFLALLPSAFYFLLAHTLDNVFFVLLCGGVFVLPMMVMRIVLIPTAAFLNPVSTLRGIVRVFAAYVLMILLWTGFFLLALYVNNDIVSDHVYFNKAVSYVLFVYVALVAARLMALFARAYAEKIRKIG